MSAFSTFSGSSKKTRNVNLSGQRNLNPFSANKWTPSGSGSSATIAQAQAEREKRHRERQELNAARLLQRVWRGHTARQYAKQLCRERFDQLYPSPPASPSSERARHALPLLLVLFDPANAQDQQRLDVCVGDLTASNEDGITTSETINSRIQDRLTVLLVKALESREPKSSETLLALLSDLFRRPLISIPSLLDRYYAILITFFHQGGQNTIPPTQQQLIADALAAPLAPRSSSHTQDISLESYQAFAYTFLTSSSLLFLQQNPGWVVPCLNLGLLSQSIIKAFSTRKRPDAAQGDGLFFLLAHFIALNRAASGSQNSTYIEALDLQLSFLTSDIRLRYNPEITVGDDTDDNSSDEDIETTTRRPLPPYAVSQLEFLVNEEGISELLKRFTSAGSLQLAEDASLLAGYTLTLLRCFPGHGDDVKIRLFHGDISTVSAGTTFSIPSVKFFWNAARSSGIFQAIAKDSEATAALVRADATQDREWRTLLLFLELYNFLLRVTDDEDFLVLEGQVAPKSSTPPSRTRACGLSLKELKDLIWFLKNLTFSLYHDLPNIMSGLSQSQSSVPPRSASSRHHTSTRLPEFAGILGMDIFSLRQTATATICSLYERDSRRPFMDHESWLMSMKFDMRSFISAVILEEQTKADLEDQEESDSEPETATTGIFRSAGVSRLSRAAQIEQQRSRGGRGTREKTMSQLMPKLEILRNIPFVVPFDIRVLIFREFVERDKFKRRQGHVDPDQWRFFMAQGNEFGYGGSSRRAMGVLGRHNAQVQRGQVFDNAFDQYYPLQDGLKEPIQITFVDKFGQPEAGIDGGGVTKEFLITVTGEAFNPGPDGPGFFVANEQNLLYPNPSSFDERAELLRSVGYQEGSEEWAKGIQDLAKRYEFLGRLVGKCMYEGILIDISFAGFFLLKWSAAGQKGAADFLANLNDLRDVDPELYHGLVTLKNYPGDVSELSLDFTINDQFRMPGGKSRTVTRLLRKNGDNITVTNKDRPLYISYVATHRLVGQPYRQTKAFLRGLGSIIDPAWLSMFNQSELQRLVGGDSSEIDVEDLRRHTEYSGLYAIGDDGLEHPTIRLFWRVMHDLRDSERRDVLKYVTSTPRAPLLGFAQLSPRFSIRDSSHDEDRLPSTSTCVNLLKLPIYTTAETLRSKLLYAVQSGAGFDLS